MTLRRTLPLAVAAVAIQAVMVLAFAWPAARVAPRDVPLVVAGPGPAATAVAQRLGGNGAFRVEQLADEDAARRAVTDRRAYGAVVVSPAGPHLLIASAASPAVAQLLYADRAAGLREAGRPRRRTSSRPTPTTRAAPPSAPWCCRW